MQLPAQNQTLAQNTWTPAATLQYQVDEYNISNNLQNGAQVTEFEMLLEQERKKHKEVKDKF